MKKVKFSEVMDKFYEYNKTHKRGDGTLTAIVVYAKSNWPENDYSEEQRSYRISSSDNMFNPSMISNAMYGDCLDGKDLRVRLDWYKWKIDYCYIEEEMA